MATKSTRYVDNLGRVILPAHIRKAMNLGVGRCIEVTLEDDNTVRIRAVKERCSVCGNAVEGKHHTEVDANGKKLVCYDCGQAIARAMMK